MPKDLIAILKDLIAIFFNLAVCVFCAAVMILPFAALGVFLLQEFGKRLH